MLEASNGPTALRLLERHTPALVLLDLVLPEQSGLDLFTVLKSNRATPYAPIIAVTARTDLLARAELADAVVAKPVRRGGGVGQDRRDPAASTSARQCCEVHRCAADLPTRYKPRRIPSADHFRATLTPERTSGNDSEGAYCVARRHSAGFCISRLRAGGSHRPQAAAI